MAATSTSHYLYDAVPLWSGTIGTGGVPDGTVTTIPLSSASGLIDGNAYIFTIDRVDANGNKTPSKREVCRGVLSGNNFINCIRGVEGTAQAHAAGAVVEILFTAHHWDKLIEGWEVEHNQDGTHNTTYVVTPTGTQTLTNKTLSTNCKLDGNADPNFTYHSFARQILINGNFDVWQRGTSFDNPDNVYTADRWKIENSVDANVKVLRSTDVPNSSSIYSVRMEEMTAVGGTGAISDLKQFIEDYKYLLGKTVTLSLYAKCDEGVTAAARIVDSVSYNEVSISNTSWTKYTVSRTIDTVATNVHIILRLNRNGLAVGKGIYFSQVQLCFGDVALPFQPKSYEEELNRCLRYYQYIEFRARGSTVDAVYPGTQGEGFAIDLPQIMRASPTIKDYSITKVGHVICTPASNPASGTSTTPNCVEFYWIDSASGYRNYHYRVNGWVRLEAEL